MISLEIKTQELKRLIDILSKATHVVMPNQPLLNSIIITASKEEQSITLSSFDLDTAPTILLTEGVEVDDDLCLGVPAKTLKKAVANLTKETVSLCAAHEDRLKLVCDTAMIELEAKSAADAPQPLSMGDLPSVDLAILGFRAAIKQSLLAVTHDVGVHVAGSVFFNQTKNQLQITSTDGRRVVAIDIPTQEKEFLFEIGISSSSLEILHEMLSWATGEDFRLVYDKDQVSFQVDNYSLVGRRKNLPKVNVRELIPEDFFYQPKVSRKELTRALKLMKNFVGDDKQVVLGFDGDNKSITMGAGVPGVSSAKECVATENSFEAKINVGFNVDYLLDGLKCIESRIITINMNAPNSAVVIKGEEESKCLYLVMPLFSLG